MPNGEQPQIDPSQVPEAAHQEFNPPVEPGLTAPTPQSEAPAADVSSPVLPEVTTTSNPSAETPVETPEADLAAVSQAVHTETTAQQEQAHEPQDLLHRVLGSIGLGGDRK